MTINGLQAMGSSWDQTRADRRGKNATVGDAIAADLKSSVADLKKLPFDNPMDQNDRKANAQYRDKVGTYKVKAGDTLEDIAEATFKATGTKFDQADVASRATDLQGAINLGDPTELQIGKRINLSTYLS